MEECAEGMGQIKNYAVKMNVQIKCTSTREEFALSTELSRNYAAELTAQIKLSLEVCAKNMGQRSNYAAKMDVQNMCTREECAEGTGQTRKYAVSDGFTNRSKVKGVA
jgi:hypothetical protein